MTRGDGRGEHSQDVADDSDAPHVGAKVYGIEVNHLGCDELGGPEEDLHLLLGVEFPGETKVNYLDAITLPWQAHNVLRLQVQVQDMIAVDEL